MITLLAIALVVTPPGLVEICEVRQLVGRHYTLNPRAAPAKRLQERVKICVHVLPDGSLPPPPINVTTERKPWSIA